MATTFTSVLSTGTSQSSVGMCTSVLATGNPEPPVVTTVTSLQSSHSTYHTAHATGTYLPCCHFLVSSPISTSSQTTVSTTYVMSTSTGLPRTTTVRPISISTTSSESSDSSMDISCKDETGMQALSFLCKLF